MRRKLVYARLVHRRCAGAKHAAIMRMPSDVRPQEATHFSDCTMRLSRFWPIPGPQCVVCAPLKTCNHFARKGVSGGRTSGGLPPRILMLSRPQTIGRSRPSMRSEGRGVTRLWTGSPICVTTTTQPPTAPRLQLSPSALWRANGSRASMRREEHVQWLLPRRQSDASRGQAAPSETACQWRLFYPDSHCYPALAIVPGGIEE